MSHAPEMRIGHIHLKVSNLERSVAFYRDVLGFEVMQMDRRAAFLSSGGYHHHIALNTWQSLNGNPPPMNSTGLFHAAIVYPSRADLAVAYRRLVEHGVELDGASDHGVSVALYFHDPDGNGLEIYYDRPAEEWPRNTEGGIAMTGDPVDLDRLLKS